MVNKIANVLGWAGTALVFAAVVIRFVRPEQQEVWNALAMAGLACVVLYVLGHWREIGAAFSGRQARYGSLATMGVLIVVGIVVAVNYVGARQNKRWDLTASQQFSLSDQTRTVLRSLQLPARMLVFSREGDFFRFRERLLEYENASRLVSVEYIDVDKEPVRARQYEVQSYGTIVIEYDGRIERVVSDSEQDITNAFLRVIAGEERKVYFTQGHGEKDPVSAERDGYNAVASGLRGENFVVESLVLAQHADVPDDASVVVVAGPRVDFLPPEIDALRRYLRRGGKVLFLIDPPEDPDAPDLPNLTALVREFGIEVGRNVVVDVSGMGQLIGTDASVPVAASYPSHPITERFNLLTAFPLARSVTPVEDGVDGRMAQAFVETSARSWAESDIRRLLLEGEVSLDEEGGDIPGPISIAAALSMPAADTAPAAVDRATHTEDDEHAHEAEADDRTPETRLVVVGDSDFAANFGVGISGNRDLFLNMVNWLGEQESAIAIRPRDTEDQRITLTADQQTRIMWLSIVIIPGIVLASGIYAWWRRR